MKSKIILIIIINLILVGEICNYINKENLNNQKQIIKEMTETEYEDNIKSLNASHEEYTKHIEESKKKIANAITEMGVQTSEEDNLEVMVNNIKNISSAGTELLWTNPNPNSGFKAQTIDLDLSEYTFIAVVIVSGSGHNLHLSEHKNCFLFPVPDTSSVNYNTIGSGTGNLRGITISKTNIAFASSNGTSATNYSIPINIFGIKSDLDLLSYVLPIS